MSANLSINDKGEAEMFSGEGKVCWHNLGTIVEGLLTSEEAIKAAHLDWSVDMRPVFVGGNEVKGYKAVARQDNNAVLSIVGNRYVPIDNRSAFSFMDEVIGSGQAVFCTAGALGKGERVWLLAKLPGHLFIDTRPNEPIERLILMSTSHDATQSLTVQQVSVRVCCQNTLNAAMKGAVNRTSVRHTTNYKDKVEQAAYALRLANSYFDKLGEVMSFLDKQNITMDEARAFTEQLVPATPNTKGEIPTRTTNIRNGILEKFVKGAGNRGQTRLDLVNGVTDYVDHNRTLRVSEDGDKQESRFTSSIWGSGAALKQRALNLLAA